MGKQMQEQPQVPKTRRSRKWLWIVGGVLVFILAVLLLIPTVLSSGGFTRWVQAKISHSTGGQANIGDLSVGWLSGVRVADFHFRGPNGWAQVDIGRITAQPSYSSLLRGAFSMDRAQIDQPHIAVDLRERPPSTEAGSSTAGSSAGMGDLSRIGDLTIRDGTVQLTSTAGQTMKIANLNSELNMRPAGRESRFKVDMALAQAQGPAGLHASGQFTPDSKTGWSLRGTTGDVTVDVNALSLDSIVPLLEMAGVQVQTKGQLTAHVTSSIRDGQIEKIDATIRGNDIDVTGPALKGDRLRTAQLDIRAGLAQTGDVINVNRLDVKTDWASVSAAGAFPRNARSLAQLAESGAANNLTGNFDVNLAAVLSQMPKTLGVQPGMKITGGTATGSITTATEAGRPTIVAKAQVAGLAGVVNGKKLNISQPMQATARLSSDKQGTRLDDLNLTTSFAKINASGDFKQIKYDGQVNLQTLQSELGSFIDLGAYRIAGQVASTGQVSIGDKTTDIAGSLSARQFVFAADANSVSIAQATVDFAVGLNSQQQTLAISKLNADTGFGIINVKNAMIPLAKNSPTPLSLQVQVDKLDLARVQPYAALFASLPKGLSLQGIAQSQVNVASEKGVYHLSSSATRIQNLQVISPGKEPFKQDPVTAMFDVYIDQKATNIARLQVDSPQIHIRKGEFGRTSQGSTTKFQGLLEAQWDLAAVGQVASNFLPGTLTLAGQKPVSLNFTSTYPTNQPNALLANLNGKSSFGFDRAAFMGFDFGPGDVNVHVENGLVRIGPFSTTLNNGKVNFSGEANLAKTPGFLRVPAPVHLAQNIQINVETADKLLKYVSPIFANAVSVSGVANFDLEQLAIPLTSGDKKAAELTGTLRIDQLQLGASTLLNQILSVGGQSLRGQMLTIHPTNIVLHNGIVRYDDMQIDVGDNPVNFRGSIGLDGVLDMTVVLPYTMEGRTVRVGRDQGAQRITVPLTGTINKPQLNLQKLVQTQLQELIFKGLEDLGKKR